MNRREAIQGIGATAGLAVVAGLTDRTGLWAVPQQPFVSTSKLKLPPGSVVRLVLKDERPENLMTGALTWHEHPLLQRFVSPPGATMTDDEQMKLMVDEFKAAKAD